MKARINDFMASIPQDARDDCRSPIVPVKSDLGYEYPHRLTLLIDSRLSGSGPSDPSSGSCPWVL